MAITVADVDTLQQYISGVMERADHHAQGVTDIALALAGAIVWRKDATSIKVMPARDGGTANVLWVSIGGQRYAFSYKHGAVKIEMRKNSTRGSVLHSFDNNTPVADVKRIFAAL